MASNSSEPAAGTASRPDTPASHPDAPTLAGPELRRLLRERGLRMTPQRQLILSIVGSLGGPISADSVYQQVAARYPGVSLSTVYRTLDVLEQLGLMRHTHVHDGVAHYHRAEEEVHQHLVCLRCRGETRLDPAVVEPLVQLLRQRYDFQARFEHTAIVGLCQACRSRGDGGEPALLY